MKAMILAAGEGVRLHPLTYELPKPLVPVVNRPVMEYILLWLLRQGIREIMVNTHYQAKQLEDHFGDGSRFGVSLHYSREEKLWGTAGGVRKVKDFFSGTFLVVGGDDLTDANLSPMARMHQLRKALATIGLTKVSDPTQYGVAVTDSLGRITQFQEKPKAAEALSSLANTGIYLFEKEIFDFIPEREPYDFGRQLFPAFLQNQLPFFGCPLDGYWSDIGSVSEYKESHWAILKGECRLPMRGREISPGIRVEEDVSIHPTARIVPPCFLSRGTVLRENATLSGFVVTGPETVVGAGATLGRVILWEGCEIGENAILQDCVVSRRITVPAQANLSEAVLARPR